jgi:hypothetical protein
LLTPTLSLAEALIVTVCAVLYVVPDAGLVIETVGAVVSVVAATFTVRLTAVDVLLFPAASNAFAVQLWLPLTLLVTLQA